MKSSSLGQISHINYYVVFQSDKALYDVPIQPEDTVVNKLHPNRKIYLRPYILFIVFLRNYV